MHSAERCGAVKHSGAIKPDYSCSLTLHPAALVPDEKARQLAPPKPALVSGEAAAGQGVTPSADLRRTGHFDM